MAKKNYGSDKSKWYAVLGGFAVIIVAIAYIIVSSILGTWNPVKWGKSESAADEPAPGALVALDGDGHEYYAGRTYTMPKSLIFLSTGSGNTRSAVSEKLTPSGNSVTVRATITPSNADDKRVTWESSDESVVIVTPTEAYSLTATITLKPSVNLDKTVNITCRSVDKPEITATCEVDQLISGDILELTGELYHVSGDNQEIATNLVFGETYKATGTFNSVAPGMGTVIGDMSNLCWHVDLTNEFCDVIRSYLAKSTDVYFDDYTFDTDTVTDTLRATPYECFYGFDDINIDVFNNAFKLAAKEYKGTQAIVTVEANYSFKGNLIGSYHYDLEMRFDVSNIWIDVSKIELVPGVIFGVPE